MARSRNFGSRRLLGIRISRCFALIFPPFVFRGGFLRSVKEESANPPLHSSAVRHYVSPRDFLGLIRAFVSLVNEKRAELEDQQVPC